MLTPKQNVREVIKGGNPDRLVKQYEYIKILLSDPYRLKYPVMPEGPGAPPVQCAWGYYNAWPEGHIGAFPMHDAEHLVCPDVAEWKKYVKAPDINFTAEDWQPCIDELNSIDRDQYFVAPFFAPGIFEMCHYLCEIQNAMMAFYEEPEAMHELIEYITDWEIEYAKQVVEYMKPDAIFHHDDWGTQRATFISTEMFNEFFLEPYKRVYGFFHDNGVELIVHHNDSYSANLVPSMIEMGIDVWQGAMSVNDLPSLVKQYGKDITFMGGIDNGKVDKADWTMADIERETDQLCRDCGKLYFIPCTSHGLSFSCFPGVYEAVDAEIDKMSKEMF